MNTVKKTLEKLEEIYTDSVGEIIGLVYSTETGDHYKTKLWHLATDITLDQVSEHISTPDGELVKGHRQARA